MSRMLTTIGSVDVFRFLDVEKDVAVKIDTGADRNSVHATGIKLVTKADGRKVLRFRLLKSKYLEFEDFDTVNVTSSNGMSEQRFKVKLSVEVFGKRYKTSFSLTNRKNMKFQVLIGKNFLKGRFLVDVSQKNLSQKKLTQ